MCVPAVFRTEAVIREALIAAAARRLDDELEDYLASAEAAFFGYLAELERAES